MARFKDRQKAIELRLQGKSYNQIRTLLQTSKSTLSDWLHDYPLTKEQLHSLQHNQISIERYRETRLRKKELRLKKIYEIQKQKIFPLSLRDIFIAGMFLYWGEGTKTRNAEIGVSNTDPSIIKFFIRWATSCLGVLKNQMVVRLHLYNDMNINKEIEFWSKKIGIPRSQFRNHYIKQSSSTRINYKGMFGHGTCNIKVPGARLSEEILEGIQAIRDYFS